jgi:hypothetical protein
MQDHKTVQYPLSTIKDVRAGGHPLERRGGPSLKRVFLEDKPAIELSHHTTLKVPLLNSQIRSNDEASQGERGFSQKSSSYNDIEEVMTPDTKKIVMERESIVEKSHPIRMIPLPANKHNKHWFRVEVLYKFSIPIFIYSLSQMILETITLLFAGNLIGYKAVAAIGLGNLFYNSTGMIIIAGINSSLNAIVSHEFSVRNYRQAGLIYHKSLLISVLFAFLFFIMNFYC